MRRNPQLADSQRASNRRTSSGSTILGVFIGLVIGILISLAVVWYMNRTPPPFVDRSQGPDTRNGNGTPAPLPGKAGDPLPEKRFQFYDILPGKSDPKPTTKPTEKAASPATVKATGPLGLQVGSFQNIKDAENLRVNLMLLGMEPKVQEVTLNDKSWHRVRLGPYTSFEELNRVKTSLAKQGMQATVVKPNE